MDAALAASEEERAAKAAKLAAAGDKARRLQRMLEEVRPAAPALALIRCFADCSIRF